MPRKSKKFDPITGNLPTGPLFEQFFRVKMYTGKMRIRRRK